MSDKEYSILLNKYNRLSASYADISQQLSDKVGQLRELERMTRITIGHARSLCKEILAKDPNEMVLGKSYSWDSLEIDTLVEKSIQTFRAYNNDRTNLMRRLYLQNEDSHLKIESLKSQIESIQAYNASRVSDKPAPQTPHEELHASDPPESDVPPWDNEDDRSTKVIEKAPYKMKQALEAGTIEAIVEDDSDVGSKDILDMEEAIGLADALSAQMKDIPVHPAKEKIQIKQEHEKKRSEAYMVNLAETKAQMTEVEWVLMDAIGAHGLSQYLQIEAKAQDLWLKSNELDSERLTNFRIRMGLQKLINLQAVRHENVFTPYVSKLAVYSLAPLGAHVFKSERGEEPVLSERDKIIAEHDNIEHGYSIMAVREMFEEGGYFKSVSCTARENRIPLEGGIAYIPDIVAVSGKFKNYFEYERGTHTQPNFNAKLNKACKVTRYINIIVPNKQTLARVAKQVESWISSRGGHKALTGKKVRIATAQFLKGKDPQHNSSWNIYFDMQSDSPTINTLEGKQTPSPDTDAGGKPEAQAAPPKEDNRTHPQKDGFKGPSGPARSNTGKGVIV